MKNKKFIVDSIMILMIYKLIKIHLKIINLENVYYETLKRE